MDRFMRKPNASWKKHASRQALPLTAENRPEFLEIADEQFMIWHRSVVTQLNKLAELDYKYKDAFTEVMFLIIAVHNLDRASLRILEILENWFKDEPFFIHSLRSMTDGHRVFRRSIPDRKLLRDILMHADEYAYGIGREQRKNGVTVPFSFRPSRYKDKHVIECGGKKLVFDIPRVRKAVDALSVAMIDLWVDYDEVMDLEGEAHFPPWKESKADPTEDGWD